MLIDFLNDCHACIHNEQRDYEAVKKLLKDTRCVNYLPAIWHDLLPIKVLEDTSAQKYNSTTNVYICPTGASDFYGVNHFSRIFDKFYRDDIIESSPLYYGAELEEVILLNTNTDYLARNFDVARESPNVIYIRINTRNNNLVHLFLIAETPEETFKRVVEYYEINLEVMVEHSKNLGSFFGEFELYKLFGESKKTYLLPRFWLSGEYAWPLPITISPVFKIGKCQLYKVPNWSEYTNKKSRRKDNNENE